MASRLLGQIALDHNALAADLRIIEGFPRIPEEYDEFSSGFWKNCSLWNDTGDSLDTQYRAYDGLAQRTPYGGQLRYIDQLLRRHFNFNYLKMVRIRNLIDAIIIPHKDFVELDRKKSSYLRVFVALEYNPESFHSDEAAVFQMQPGEVWWLDAAIVHAAANFSANSRAHLCLDFQFPSSEFDASEIFADRDSINFDVTPTMKHRERFEGDNKTLAAFTPMLTQHTFRDVIFLLSKIHFDKDVCITDCFDWLTAMAVRLGDHALEEKSRRLRRYMIGDRALGERFSFREA